jgi:hypothetical protein
LHFIVPPEHAKYTFHHITNTEEKRNRRWGQLQVEEEGEQKRKRRGSCRRKRERDTERTK